VSEVAQVLLKSIDA
jgi:hypothetical protein